MTGFSYPSGFTAGRAKAGSTGLQSPTGLSYSGATRLFSGMADPGATVSISKDGVVVGNATADGSGNWSYLFATAPAAGSLLSARQSVTAASAESGAITVSAASPTLNALSLSASAFTGGAAAGSMIGAITGVTAGSTLAIVPADARVAVSGTNLVVGALAASAGSFDVTIRETLAGATNSPRDTALSITAEAASALGPFPDFAPLFMRVSADHAGNEGETVALAFAPADIDTTAGRIYLPTANFEAFTTMASCKGTPGHFTNAGGSLPAVVADASKQYFLSPAGGGWYDVYCEPSETDWQTTPGGFASDIRYPAQNFANRVNKLAFASQGSGTHSFVTKAEKICSAVVNTLATKPAYNFQASSVTDRHTWFEIFTDAQGKKFLNSQRLVRDLLKGGPNYLNMGKTFFQKGSPNGVTARPELSGKRSIIMFSVIYADMTDEFGIARGAILPAGVNTTTGVFTVKAGDPHGFVTGEPVSWRLISGTMPEGYSDGGSGYARAVNSLTFTVHASAADASNNVSPIIPTTQGSGQFQFYQTSIPGDYERMRFVAEVTQPNGTANTLTPRYNGTLPGDVSLQMSSDMTMTGSNNGNCGIGGRTSRPLGEAKAVRIIIPPGAVAPTRADTGQPLATGTYWQSLTPGSSVWVRYHDTQAQAQAAAGIATSALTGPSACIKCARR